MENKIRKFLDYICVDMGFCLPLIKIEDIVEKKYENLDAFISDIFTAEGLNPEIELHLFREVKRKYIGKYGSTL